MRNALRWITHFFPLLQLGDCRAIGTSEKSQQINQILAFFRFCRQLISLHYSLPLAIASPYVPACELVHVRVQAVRWEQRARTRPCGESSARGPSRPCGLRPSPADLPVQPQPGACREISWFLQRGTVQPWAPSGLGSALGRGGCRSHSCGSVRPSEDEGPGCAIPPRAGRRAGVLEPRLPSPAEALLRLVLWRPPHWPALKAPSPVFRHYFSQLDWGGGGDCLVLCGRAVSAREE